MLPQLHRYGVPSKAVCTPFVPRSISARKAVFAAATIVAYNRDHYMHETDEHDATFSPDGRWLAYSLSRSTRLRALHLYEIATNKDTEISSPMNSDYRPAFSSDGELLFFVSDRHENPVLSDRETNTISLKSGGIFVTTLSVNGISPFALHPGDSAKATPTEPTARSAKEQGLSSPSIKVDFEGQMQRAIPVPVEPNKIDGPAGAKEPAILSHHTAVAHRWQFYPQLGKEALIIDDRWNPGGNVDEMVLERLRRVLSSMQTGRDRVPQTQPDQIMTGPKVMLINQNSASDGDVFPFHFRSYGLGELIGTRTWGGVRGLRKGWPLSDGGNVIVPEITFYDLQDRWAVENRGVEPDVEVADVPGEFLQDHDIQLETAVQRLMMKIGPVRHDKLKVPSDLPAYAPGGIVPLSFQPQSNVCPAKHQVQSLPYGAVHTRCDAACSTSRDQPATATGVNSAQILLVSTMKGSLR